MKNVNTKSVLRTSIIGLWMAWCFSLFILNAGLFSHIHQFFFEDWGGFIPGLTRVGENSFILDLFSASFGATLFFVSCTALGFFALTFLGDALMQKIDTKLGILMYFGTAFILGEIIVSSIFLLLATYAQLTPAAVLTGMVVMIILGLMPAIRFCKSMSGRIRLELQKNIIFRFEHFLAIGSIVIVFLALLYSSSRLSYDAVGMYFSDEKLIAMTDRIQFFSDVFVVSSLHVGVQYAAIIQIFGDQAARMYSWIGGLIILISCLALGENLRLTRRALLIWLIMILTSTAFLDLMGDGKIDLQTSVPMFIAAYWMVGDRDLSSGKEMYFLIGLLAGFSIISRLFNAFIIFLFISAFFLWRMYLRRMNGRLNFRTLLFPAVMIGTGVFLLLGFHLLVNDLIMGNALAPLKTLSNVNSSIWHYPFDQKDIWSYRLLYPFVLTFFNSPQSLGNISPIFIAFIPFLLVTRFRAKVKFSRDVIGISVISLAILILWVILFYMIVEIRYVLFLWLLLFIPVAMMVDSTLDSEDQVSNLINRFFLAALVLFIIVRIVVISFSTYSPVDAKGNPQCYDSPLCDFFRPLNQLAPRGDRVLALNAYRYYMRQDLFACSSKADEYISLQEESTNGYDSFWEEVVRQGYTYVVYEANYSKRHLNIQLIPSPSDTPSWLTLETISGTTGKNLVVYHLVFKNPPTSSEKTCAEISPKLWLVEGTSH